MEKITVSASRMHIQEIALLGLVKCGMAHKKQLTFGRTIYKLDVENPWVPSDGRVIKGLR